MEGAAEKRNDLYGWAVGEAWSYRREAYREMADILSSLRTPRLQKGSTNKSMSAILTKVAARDMHQEVYAAEPLATRHLHQRVTPHMSDAAREAREAIDSSLDDWEIASAVPIATSTSPSSLSSEL